MSSTLHFTTGQSRLMSYTLTAAQLLCCLSFVRYQSRQQSSQVMPEAWWAGQEPQEEGLDITACRTRFARAHAGWSSRSSRELSCLSVTDFLHVRAEVETLQVKRCACWQPCQVLGCPPAARVGWCFVLPVSKDQMLGCEQTGTRREQKPHVDHVVADQHPLCPFIYQLGQGHAHDAPAHKQAVSCCSGQPAASAPSLTAGCSLPIGLLTDVLGPQVPKPCSQPRTLVLVISISAWPWRAGICWR